MTDRRMDTIFGPVAWCAQYLRDHGMRDERVARWTTAAILARMKRLKKLMQTGGY
jgi:hypothetical protein